MATAAYAELARQLSLLMGAIRASATYLKTEQGYAVATLARVTGLHKNSIMKLDNPRWKPAEETVEKLELLITRAEAKRNGVQFDDENVARGRPFGSIGNGHVKAAAQRTKPVKAAKTTPATPPAKAKKAKPATRQKESVSRRAKGKPASTGHAARAS